MTGIRNDLEKLFENFTYLICKHRWKTLLFIMMVISFFAIQVRHIKFDTSTISLLHDKDPHLINYKDFREKFGRDQVIIILIKNPDVFNIKFLEKLRRFHEELEENVPMLHDISSIINARNIRGDKDQIIVEDLFENWPQTQEALSRIRTRAIENPTYKDLLLSRDGTYTAVIIETESYSSSEDDDPSMSELDAAFDEEEKDRGEKKLLTEEENEKIVLKVKEIKDKYNSDDFQTFLAGSPVLELFVKKTMLKDMAKFTSLSILTITIFLFIMFRRISGFILPLIVVNLSTVSTLGLMAFFNTPFMVPTQILPNFLLAVGVGDSVHLLVIFFQHYNQHGDKTKAIAYANGHSGLAILMTSLTTAGGLLSFSTSNIVPIGDLGIFAACGVMLAFLYTVVLLPVLITFVPLKPAKGKVAQVTDTFVDRILLSVGKISTTHPVMVIIICVILVLLSIVGIKDIGFYHNPLEWLPKDNPSRIAIGKVDTVLRGTSNLEIIIDTGRENGLHDPALLNKIEECIQYVENYETDEIYVGKAWTVTAILKEIHMALNENRNEYYAIPQDKNLIAQEFILFENSGSDDLEKVVDSQFSLARFTIKVPYVNAISYKDLIDNFTGYFEAQFPEIKIVVTGLSPLMIRIVTVAIHGMFVSYIYALIVITFLMVLLIGRLKIGLLSMIPNITPILLMLGMMKWWNIPMDLFTIMVGSIAIGLAVDDTVHFMHNFRRYYEQSGDANQAVIKTLHTTGRAMLVTTCVLSIGFFVYLFASMSNLFNFGLLTGVTIIMALLSDYFLAPALMVLVHRKQ